MANELAYVRARREAADLLKSEWDGEFPVKLSPFTVALDAVKRESILATGLSGLVVKKAHEPASIVLNMADTAARRRFTWAHELGHIVERSAIAGDGSYSFTDARGGKYDLHEFFADEFAGALLMPADTIRAWKDSGLSVPEMANRFGVSVPALRKRLDRLTAHPA